jgi:hypothetical protein
MSILDDVANNRVANVRTIAARLAKFGEGYSIREFLDALALCAGSLIRVAYRGNGVGVAVNRFVEELCRAAAKE